jgi:hypothetical protein
MVPTPSKQEVAMRFKAAAILGMTALAAATQAWATEPQVWQGTVFIDSVTGACTTANVAAVGDYYTMVYRPIIAGSQTGPEGLTFIGARDGQAWYTLSDSASFKSAAEANILTLGSHATSDFATSAGGYSLTILPEPIGLTTPTVTITGLLSNFWDVSGCNVTISAALAARV